jgi:hypothetical protein
MLKNDNQTRQTSNHPKDKTAGKRGAIVFEQEDIQLIYRALRIYQPTTEEAQLYDILLEQFEEVLAVDFLEVPY